jgi:hypothetical protein
MALGSTASQTAGKVPEAGASAPAQKPCNERALAPEESFCNDFRNLFT